MRSQATVADGVSVPRAKATIAHARPKYWLNDSPAYLDDAGKLVAGYKWIQTELGPIVDPSTMDLISVEDSYNVKTTAGMDFLHTQGYGTAGLGTNGLNYIALSNDILTETTASTTLSNEIAVNGLARAQGAVAHTAGASTTTIQKVFTLTGSQSCQKAALFNAASAGTMNHALAFTLRAMLNGDTLTVTFTITIA